MHDTTTGAIGAVLTRIAAAWTAGDAAAYAAEFTDDATYVTFQGDVLRGRAAIADVHRLLFAGPLRGSRMDPPDVPSGAVRFPRPDVAHVVLSGGVALAGQVAAADDRASTVSFLLVDDGTWRVAAFQNTRRAGAR